MDYDDGRLFNYSGSSGATLTYRYVINGEEYMGQRAAFGGGGISDIVQNTGENIKIHYNPLNHTESVVHVGLRLGYLLQILVGIGLIWVGKSLWHRLK